MRPKDRPLRPGLAARPVVGCRGLGEGPVNPAQDPGAGQAGVLPDPGGRRDGARRSGAGRRHALDHRGRLQDGQRRGRVSTRGASCERPVALAPAGMEPALAAPAGPAGTGTSRWPCWRTPAWPRSARWRSGGDVRPGPTQALLPLTVPEVRRLLRQLVWAPRPEPAAVLAWWRWRRRHPQRAQRCHWRRRALNKARL